MYVPFCPLKSAYRLTFGEEFNVSTDSLYWEIVGHIFADEFAEMNRGGRFDVLWKRIQISTKTINIGDDIIVEDGNRAFWDWIAKKAEN